MTEFVNIVESKTGDLSKIECRSKLFMERLLLVPYETSIRAEKEIPNSSLSLLDYAPHLFMFTEESLLKSIFSPNASYLNKRIFQLVESTRKCYIEKLYMRK